jgi:hypothetical protein
MLFIPSFRGISQLVSVVLKSIMEPCNRQPACKYVEWNNNPEAIHSSHIVINS